MKKWDILSLKDTKEWNEAAIDWFHAKWQVPKEAYRESIEDSQARSGPVPHWYLAVDQGRIAAGLGVIENDFHKRKDLTPNICAVYVEEPYRRQGLSRQLMERACSDLALQGIEEVYLITGHTEYYEHCGWDFYGIIEEEDGSPIRMYHRKTK